MSKLEETNILKFSHYFQPFIEFSPSLFGPLLCSPTLNFLIFRKNIIKNSAHKTHFEPSRFLPDPFGRTAFSPGLQAQKPGPGPGKWPPPPACLARGASRPPRAVGCHPTARSAPERIKTAGRPPAPANPNSFSPSPLSPLSTAA